MGAAATVAAAGAWTPSRGKKAMSDTDPTSQRMARPAATGCMNTARRSRSSRPGSEAIEIDVALLETMKIPITATYMVMQSRHIFCSTTKDA